MAHSNSYYPNLGKNIRGLRKAFGETQLDLAFAIGARGPSVISQYESGERMPERDYLTRIAKHYRITEFELLYDDFSDMRNLTQLPVNDSEFGLKMMSKMFPLICTPQALENPVFKEAYKIHTRLIDSFSVGGGEDEKEIVHCMTLYEEARQNGLVEAAANHLWWLMIIGYFTVIITPRLIENVDTIKPDNISAKFIFDGLLPTFDEADSEKEFDTNQDRISFLEECEADLLLDILLLKKSKEYSDLGDFYLALRHKLGLLRNTLSMEMNRVVGEEMLLAFYVIGNKYCKRYFAE